MSINFILTVCIHNLNAIFSTNTYLFVNRKKQTLVYACTLLIQEVVGIDHHLKSYSTMIIYIMDALLVHNIYK